MMDEMMDVLMMLDSLSKDQMQEFISCLIALRDTEENQGLVFSFLREEIQASQ